MVDYFNYRQKIVKKGDVFGVYCYGKFNEGTDKGGQKMKTKFIMGGRQTGKTTKLIREAMESPCSSVIVAANRYHAIRIRDMLYKMYGDRYIVPVITIRDIVTHSREMDGRFPNPPKLYIDELTACLSEFTSCDIAAAVIDTEEGTKEVKELYAEAISAFRRYSGVPEMNDNREYAYRVDVCRRNSLLNPHIDHVIFNGPATIVFWKDGTKTVVKYDGKGRKDRKIAIMYAFMRKIYGEGRPYHDILNEIEEALK